MILPKKLKKGSHIRIIAPSRSFGIISQSVRDIAQDRFAQMGLEISYSEHADEINDFASSSVDSRLADLHAAFADPSVDGILTAIGGFNSNQLLEYIDYDLIRDNPKVLCGFSDITALLNAITTKTDMLTYYGPHFSTFGMLHGIDYTIEYFKKCLFEQSEFDIAPSPQWRDDPWFAHQEPANLMDNDGYWIINEGQTRLNRGTIIGGHLTTLQLLHGTPYMPSLRDKILFIEVDGTVPVHMFYRDLNALIMQKDFDTVKALVIGRFQKASEIDRITLTKVIKSFTQLDHLPILANADFGHSTPNLTIPLGGTAEVDTHEFAPSIKILNH